MWQAVKRATVCSDELMACISGGDTSESGVQMQMQVLSHRVQCCFTLYVDRTLGGGCHISQPFQKTLEDHGNPMFFQDLETRARNASQQGPERPESSKSCFEPPPHMSHGFQPSKNHGFLMIFEDLLKIYENQPKSMKINQNP